MSRKFSQSPAAYALSHRYVINIKDAPFNARGDGVTDDTAAFTLAQALYPFYTIYAPAGTYLIDPLFLNGGIVGDGAFKTKFAHKPAGTGFLLRFKSSSGQYPLDVQGFQIDCNAAGQSGWQVEGSVGIVERLRVIGAQSVGFQIGNAAGASGTFWTRIAQIYCSMIGAGTGFIADTSPGSANANVISGIYVSGFFATGWDIRGVGNHVVGGTVEWRAGVVDCIKLAGSGNTIDTPYLEAVGGANPSNSLVNFSGNGNTARDLWLQAGLDKNLDFYIKDTGTGNRCSITKNLRHSSQVNQSLENYFPNPKLDYWIGTNQPWGFTNIGAGAVQDLTTLFQGNPTLKMTIAASALTATANLITGGSGNVTAYDVTAFRGRTITMSVACKTALAGFGGLKYTITAGVTINGNAQASHSGSGNWETFVDTVRVPADATQIAFQCVSHQLGTVGTGDIWFGNPAITFGREAVNGADAMVNVNDIPRDITRNFTPVVVGTTTAGAGTYSRQFGRYEKIGKRVFFEITLVWTAHTGTGNIRISGLPYTSTNIDAFHSPPCSVYFNNLVTAAGKQLAAFVTNNTSTIDLWVCDPAGGAVASVAMDVAAGIQLSGHYEIP